MAAVSKHHLDVYMWVIKVIESCTKVEHISGSLRMVQRYKKQYPTAPKGLSATLRSIHYAMVKKILGNQVE